MSGQFRGSGQGAAVESTIIISNTPCAAASVCLRLKDSAPSFLRSLSNLSKMISLFRYTDLYDSDSFTVTLFRMPPHFRLPLHSHPNITIISKVLRGKVNVSTFTTSFTTNCTTAYLLITTAYLKLLGAARKSKRVDLQNSAARGDRWGGVLWRLHGRRWCQG